MRRIRQFNDYGYTMCSTCRRAERAIALYSTRKTRPASC